MSMNSQPTYQQLVRGENYAIFVVQSSGVLHFRLVSKSSDQTEENYETQIRSLESEGKLSQYFQNFHDLLQHMKTPSNLRFNLDDKYLEIIAKGPTKKASETQLAWLKLKLLSPAHLNNNHNIFDHIHSPSQDPEEWMDTLASDIISIIQSKSKVHQRHDMMKQFVKKTELTIALQQIKREYKNQIERNKFTLKQLENIFTNMLQKSRAQQNNIQDHIKNKKDQEIAMQTKQYQLIIQKFKNQQLFCFQNQIKNIQQSFILLIEKNHEQFVRLMKQQSEHSKKIMLQDINTITTEMYNRFSTKQQIDAIIKKVQNIGGKLQTFILESIRRDKLTQKIYIHERKLNQIQDKFQKQKSRDSDSPKKDYLQAKILQRKVPASQWLDSQCSHFRRVTLSDNMITMTSLGGAHLFGKIRMKQKSKFHVTIQSMLNRIGLGVIDTQYKQKVLYGEQLNKICYLSDKRCKDGDNKKQEQGLGFRVNETITVSVDMKLGVILWKVGNSLRYSWQSDQLRNSKIQWVPYVHLYDKEDRISIVQ